MPINWPSIIVSYKILHAYTQMGDNVFIFDVDQLNLGHLLCSILT